MIMVTNSIQTLAANALKERNPDQKAALTQALWVQWQDAKLEISDNAIEHVECAGLPNGLVLVPPDQVPRRRLGSVQGCAAMLHAVAHIEFNAINLALDVVCRFPGMPTAFYNDWLRVAKEEAEHFLLVRTRLRELGFDYGDFPAHNGLWEMARKTTHDLLARMAMVPRMLEARGLDVTPGLQARLLAAGEQQGAALLDIIFRDEVGHVTVGNHWFRWLCKERGLDPVDTFRAMLPQFDAPRHKGEMNKEARSKAGFTEEEMLVLAEYANT